MYLPQGTELNNRYVVEAVLGHGGFGITYAAYDRVSGGRVAIKEYLPRHLATRSEGKIRVSVFRGEARQHYDYGLKKFKEEVQALRQFDRHPNVVSVRDYFEANGTAYMVMEYAEGVTLKEYLQNKGGRLSFDEATGIMMPVMDALREVHQVGLLHRDISPDNIYITTAAQVRVIDFGAARFFAGEQSKSLSVILKQGYAPEEQYRSSGKQGPWTDVYATAATLYKLLTGQNPPDALDRLAEDNLQPPSRLGVNIPPKAERALLQALAVQAGQRFLTMGEFQQALIDGKLKRSQRQPAPAPFPPTPKPVYKPVSPSISAPPPVSARPEAPPSHYPQSPRRSANPAAIAAGIFAGVIGLGLVVGLFWWFMQNSHFPKSAVQVQKPATQKAGPGPSRVQAPTPKASQPVKTRFTKAKDGVIKDNATGLEWYAGPDRYTYNSSKAKAWTAGLTVAGGGWRMPTVPELKALYQRGAGPNNLDPIFQTTGSVVWSGEIDARSKHYLFFDFSGAGMTLVGLPNLGVEPRAFAVRYRRPQQVKTRFTKSKDGVITDSATGLEWYAGPDRNTDWNQAKSWTESLTVAGGGWRLPTVPELRSLFQKGVGPNNRDSLFQTTGYLGWSGDLRDASSAGGFDFHNGHETWGHLAYPHGRAFAVRSRQRNEVRPQTEDLRREGEKLAEKIRTAHLNKDINKWLRCYSPAFPNLGRLENLMLELWKNYDIKEVNYRISNVQPLGNNQATADIIWNIQVYDHQNHDYTLVRQEYQIIFKLSPSGWKIANSKEIAGLPVSPPKDEALMSMAAFTPIVQGYDSIRAGEYEAAQNRFVIAVKRDHNNPFALNNLAVVKEREGELNDALIFLKDASKHANKYLDKVTQTCFAGAGSLAAKPSRTKGARSSIAPIIQENINKIEAKVEKAEEEKPGRQQNLQAEQTPSAAPLTSPKKGRAVFYVTSNHLFMRSKAGLGWPLIEVLERNSEVEKLGQMEQWVQVRVKRSGQIGWVDSRYLSTSPVAANRASSAPSKSAIPDPKEW